MKGTQICNASEAVFLRFPTIYQDVQRGVFHHRGHIALRFPPGQSGNTLPILYQLQPGLLDSVLHPLQCGSRDACTVNIRTMAALCNCSRSSVKRALHKLRERGFIDAKGDAQKLRSGGYRRACGRCYLLGQSERVGPRCARKCMCEEVPSPGKGLLCGGRLSGALSPDAGRRMALLSQRPFM